MDTVDSYSFQDVLDRKNRNEFAKVAMMAMIIHGDTNNRSPEYLSKSAFAIADEMVKKGKE